ncbi:hypothetical protein K438DRAFT_1799236, partial [Mycena galopus ATCC 62051]
MSEHNTQQPSQVPSERNPLQVTQIRASGYRIGVGEEPDSGVLQTGVSTGSKTGVSEGNSDKVSVQPCQGTSVAISSPRQ